MAPIPYIYTARPLSRLADQSLMAAVVSYYRDVSAVMEAQRKATPAPAGGNAPYQQQQQTQQQTLAQPEDAPRQRPQRFPKRGGAGDRAKAAADAAP